jgi:hypothetical protein
MNVQQQTVKINPTKKISHTAEKAIVPHAAVDAVMMIAQSVTVFLRGHPMTEHSSQVGLW